ncbi:zinc transporter ZntB [Sphingomonas hengshuiensis]|uniref:Magnesium transporter CorA n=1 Tax=Sphingomonas hengshuiensis TaxID=1609977 RepID=A0A7U4JB43_9SPHN|nr:zinc transporter ZntB [Sphingomonas hengshuiensis]AJP73492.1 magnesium transporter CorA [Sphingomonas hengshuiensis]
MSGFAYVVKDGKAEARSLKQAVHDAGDLTWVHLTTNDERAKLWLGGEAKLSAYVIEALTAVETRPRCDAVGTGAVINLRGLSSDPLEASDPLASIRIYAVGKCVFSVTRKQLTALPPVRELVEGGQILDPGDLIAAFAQEITEELDPMVATLGDTLDDCEEQIAEHKAFALRRRVNQTRSQAIGYRRFLNPQRAALEKLAALPGDWLRDDDRLHLSAAADRAARMAEELESIRERAALTHETLTDLRAEQIDQRSLMIAIVAMVFLPLTFLTGLLGMNVDGIPYAHEPWAFWGVVGVSVALSGGISAYFIRRHWFDG